MILTPEYIFRNVEAIRPEFLAQLGIRALTLNRTAFQPLPLESAQPRPWSSS